MTTQPHTKSPSRKRPTSLVYVELSSVNGGMMRDIAEDSFALRAMIPVRAGDKTPFRFSLDEATRIEGEGLIDAIEEDGRVANIRILEISAVAREQLLDWLTRPDAPSAHVPPAPQSNNAPNSSLEELRNELRTAVPAKSSGEAPQQLPASNLRKWPSLPKITLPEKQSPASPPNLPAGLRSTSESALPQNSAEISRPAPLPLPPLNPRDLPPGMLASLRTPSSKLEPLPRFEDYSHHTWLSSFTLGRAITIMLLLTCIAGSLAYRQQLGEALIWLGQQISGAPQSLPQPSSEPAASAPVTQSPSASVAPKRQNNNSSSAQKSPRSENTPAAPVANSDSSSGSNSEVPANKSVEVPPITQSPEPAAKTPASPTLVPANQQNRPEPSAEPAPEPGQIEFEQAQQLLRAGRNSGVRAEIPAAVHLLWASVEKGNVSAELALAELYRTGDGVTKNCDQTRILLTAAARKGNPEAQKKLHDLLQHPCP